MNDKNFSPSFSPIGDLLDRSFKIFKEKFYVFLGIISFPLVFSILSYFIRSYHKNLILSLSVSIALFIVSYWSGLACLYVIKDREEKIGVRESFKRAWFKLFPYFWIIILAALASLGGFILLIIPGIIVGVSLIFVSFILISEDLRGMDVLLKSRHLVKGRWWPVFGRLLLIGILAFSITTGIYFVSFPLLFLSQKMFFEALISFVSLMLSCFVNIYCFLIYEDLKKVKEAVLFEKKEGRIKYLILIFVALACLILFSFFVIIKGKGEGQKHFDQKRLEEIFKQLKEEEAHKKQEENQIEDWSSVANWKIYRNEENGFELKYPKDWKVKGEERKIFIGASYWREGMPEGGRGLFIKIRNISLEDFIKEYEKPLFGEKIIKQEDYILDKIEGVKLTAATALGIETNFIFITKKNKSYIIDFCDFDPFQQAIISTFKFIEEK